MPVRTVGPNGEFATIADAIATPVDPGDIIQLEVGYTDEIATITIENLTFDGDTSNTGIALILSGVTNITLTGTAPINVFGDANNNTITGNGGDNLLDGGLATDTVSGGDGTDRLSAIYSDTATAVIMNAPTGSLAAGYSGSVTDGDFNTTTFDGIEHFSISGGTASDTISTGDGDDNNRRRCK